jgi:hypothetical protein
MFDLTLLAMKKATSSSGEAVDLRLLEDSHAGLEVGAGCRDQAHSKRSKPLLDVGDLLGGAIAGEDDLAVGLVEVVEGVEELLLGTLFAGEELDVVEEEKVDGAVAVSEVLGLVVADRADELVGELLRGEVFDANPGVGAGETVADGMEQMGLAETDAAVDEEGVVGGGRELGHGETGRLGELVGGADDEGLERVTPIEVGGRRGGGGRGGRGGRRGGAVDGEDDVGPGAEASRGGGLEIWEVVVLDVAADKLIGDGYFQAVVPVAEETARPEPGVEHLGRELPFEEAEETLPEVVRHRWNS